MFTKIVALLTGLLPYLTTLAANTATKVDDLCVAGLKALTGDKEFIDLLTEWNSPSKGEGFSAAQFPHTFEAAVAMPDGHRLLALLERLGINSDTMKMLWPFIVAALQVIIA